MTQWARRERSNCGPAMRPDAVSRQACPVVRASGARMSMRRWFLSILHGIARLLTFDGFARRLG